MMLCILLCGCSQAQQSSDFCYSFDKAVFTPVDTGVETDYPYPKETIADVEQIMMEEVLCGAPYGLIAECTVTGKSKNHIMTVQESSLGPHTDVASHVLTPIRIEKIYYKGEAVSLSVGEVALLEEWYIYLTDETPDLQERYGYKDSKIVTWADDYNPVIEGQRYIMFLCPDRTYKDHIDPYQPPEGMQILMPFANGMSIYGIGSKESVEANMITGNANYWEAWEQVMEVYGDYEGKQPFSEPQVYAQNKNAKD